LRELRIGVQASDFVLVLVRHQLGVVARDGFGEPRGSGALLPPSCALRSTSAR
jgi:hypothetical protein